MTISQTVNNNYVKAPLTTETTTKKMVEPTRETAAVNAGTSTEGLCGDGGSYHPAANSGDTSCDEEDEINVPMALSVFRDGILHVPTWICV